MNWRYESARKDGSGKLNTFDEISAKKRGNTKLKRQVSKDTRLIGKKLIRKELQND